MQIDLDALERYARAGYPLIGHPALALIAKVRELEQQRDTARGVPEGWKIVADKEGIEITSPTGDGCYLWNDDMRNSDELRPNDYPMLFRELCRAMLAAAPTPPDGDAGRDRRDAERYRHVRAHGMPKLCPAGFYYHDGVFYPTADAAIDAYVAASKGEGGA